MAKFFAITCSFIAKTTMNIGVKRISFNRFINQTTLYHLRTAVHMVGPPFATGCDIHGVPVLRFTIRGKVAILLEFYLEFPLNKINNLCEFVRVSQIRSEIVSEVGQILDVVYALMTQSV